MNNFNTKGLVNVILESIKNTFSGTFVKFFSSSYGVICAILLTGKNFYGFTIYDSVTYGLYFVGAILLLRFFLYFSAALSIYLHNTYIESKYGYAIITLTKTFKEVNSLKRKPAITDDELTRILRMICDNLQEVFNTINSSKCCVSIKVPIDGSVSGNAILKNISRDSEHTEIRDDANYNAIEHTIIGNTAFTKALNKVNTGSDNVYYINSDIHNTDGYDNTSFTLYDDGKLPYQSEIVIPVTKMDDEAIKVLGFLCVDCVSPRKFELMYDSAIVEGVAEGISDLLIANKK